MNKYTVRCHVNSIGEPVECNTLEDAEWWLSHLTNARPNSRCYIVHPEKHPENPIYEHRWGYPS